MKAVAYIRVSDTSQVEGHSLDAQERLFYELCKSRGWEPVGVYREEGKSAYNNSVAKRPVLQQLMADSAGDGFEVVVVHTLDRWARNMKVLMETVTQLLENDVGLVSITENIDWSSSQGRLVAQMIGSFAEFSSGVLSTHTKKGVAERARKGLHLGSLPFGYQLCDPPKKGRKKPCAPAHKGGIHKVPREARAVEYMFREYSTGTTSMVQLARWMNREGYRTRNRRGDGRARLFTNASVRGILHNHFYAGKVIRQGNVHEGVHRRIVSEELFHAVQATATRNSGRSETLQARPEREYLLKGLIRCHQCRMPLWAQTYNNGNRYYREQARSRSTTDCPADGKAIKCDIVDDQVEAMVSSLVLPAAWLDRVLAQIHVADEAKTIAKERTKTDRELKRVGQAYADGALAEKEYRRRLKLLKNHITTLVAPAVDAAAQAGKLLQDLPALWGQADLGERRLLLTAMLDAVYVDTIDKKGVVSFQPKVAFKALFDIAAGEWQENKSPGKSLGSGCQINELSALADTP
jgi:site-specific DNA recombinase